MTTKTQTPVPVPHQPPPKSSDSPEDGHEGATEDQVSDTPPPAGPLYEDEPKQG